MGRSPSVTEHSMETRWPNRRFSPTLNLLMVGGTVECARVGWLARQINTYLSKGTIDYTIK